MELKSVATIILYVANIQQSVLFYKDIGFRSLDNDAPRVYLNWFSIEFRENSAKNYLSANGQRIGIKVDDVDIVYETLVQKNLTVIDQVHSVTAGTKECSIADPDGYVLTFFSKK